MRFRTNGRKALEVALWLANREPGIDVHRVLKLLFFADIWHINKYGRPVVGDNYCALEFGPAAMSTYDILEKKPGWLNALGAQDFPFEVRPGPRKKHVYPTRDAEVRKLSESDRAALNWAYEKYGHLDFDTLSRLSHEHPAWKNGRKAPGTHMDYADFLDEAKLDPEQRAEIEERAQYGRC